LRGKIGFRIYERDNIIQDNLINRYKNLSSCIVGDAMGRFRVLSSNIRPVVPTRRIVGRAITVLTRGIDNLLMHKAMEMAGKGDIIIVDTYGETDASGWGGLMTRAAVKLGIEGVVIDGSVRDLDDLRTLEFPVYARATTARGCYKDGPGEINCNISCGGVSISPGDLILADEDGVVCVPFADVEYVLQQAIKQVESEKKRIAEINNGEVFKTSINEILANKGVL
jgi:regulator of RNase E activity RraA